MSADRKERISGKQSLHQNRRPSARQRFMEAHGAGPHICCLCDRRIHGRFVVHQLDGDPSNGTLENLAPAHETCRRVDRAAMRKYLRMGQEQEKARRAHAKARDEARRQHRETAQRVAFLRDQLDATIAHIAKGDPSEYEQYRLLVETLDSGRARLVAGWRQSGHTDTAIGAVFGISRQAVQQRWPRARTTPISTRTTGRSR